MPDPSDLTVLMFINAVSLMYILSHMMQLHLQPLMSSCIRVRSYFMQKNYIKNMHN